MIIWIATKDCTFDDVLYVIAPNRVTLVTLLVSIAAMSYTVPSFSGQSYLRLKQLHHVNRELHIELEFKSLNEEGILLYSGEEQEQAGDFVSLALRNGFVEFR